MDKIKAALIDDGIDSNSNLFGANIIYYELQNGLMNQVEPNDKIAMVTHGSICSMIFTYYSEVANYDLFSLKIIDSRSQKTSISNMLAALEWCLDHGIQLVCMSIGSTRHSDFSRVEKTIDKLTERGVTIVAACSNMNTITFPASARNVIGVRCDPSGLLKDKEYLYLKHDFSNINIISSTSHEQLSSRIGMTIPKANSFATPYIAALACEAMIAGCSNYREVLHYLDARAINKNNIVDLTYIKNYYPLWREDINIPVIAIYTKFDFLITNICCEFQGLGYHAVGISDKHEGDQFYILDYRVFQAQMMISPSEVLQCVNNAQQPDICIIGISDMQFLEALAISNMIDAFIYTDPEHESPHKSHLPTLQLSAEKSVIVRNIIKLFNDGE